MRYWDVFPKHIKISKSTANRTVPLTISGTLVGVPVFASTDEDIASVNSDGVVSLGTVVGAAMIVVYDSAADGQTTIRYIQVEVVAPEEPQAVWQPWEES
ncbi:MAG TPA: hypothetical protein PLO37_06470 [Candidatus Hydrogenedentes bacterium]|nr:hypothetical protein [Candidatus Hydrogenedentota bacterium]HPG66475.1 hypothetical protein [Candidatus Hydrogenedentota bacterium]